MKKLDLTKPVQARNGSPARIIATDAIGGQPIVALVLEDGREYVRRFFNSGVYCHDEEITGKCDLINTPQKVKVECWLNVYSWGCVACATKEKADDVASDDRLACLHIFQEVPEGEGL